MNDQEILLEESAQTHIVEESKFPQILVMSLMELVNHYIVEESKRRTPSNFGRKSTPVTPKKYEGGLTIPQSDEQSNKLLAMAKHKVLHLSTVTAHNGGQAWEKTQSNQFQIRNNTPSDVMEYLKKQSKQNLTLRYAKPDDLDSTEAFDSFMESLYVVIDENVQVFNESVKQKCHLATGIRTEQCQDMLNYVSNLQSRNKLLHDSVEFFEEQMHILKELENDKEDKENVITSLKKDKEELTMLKYDQERRLSELLGTSDALRVNESELKKQVKLLSKKFQEKKEECESLQFRLKHSEDLSNMMEPPNMHSSLGDKVQLESEPGDPQNDGEEKVKGLESINKKLQIELGLMKQLIQKQQEVTFKDNIDHFSQIQELFNKAQIENKNLEVTNKKIESMLESKEKLISHLENKITTTMIEKEEIIIKLKSEIVLLKNHNESHKNNFNVNLKSEVDKIEKSLQSQYQDQVKKLEGSIQDLSHDKEELMAKLQKLTKDHELLNTSYNHYRNQKDMQEMQREKHVHSIEEQLRLIHDQHDVKIAKHDRQFEDSQNENQMLIKEKHMLELRLKYVSECTDTLVKQKYFIIEEIEKSRMQLKNECQTMQSKLLDENQNKDYLISVKKAAKQAENMVDIGVHSLSNIQQIVNFFKVEELTNIVRLDCEENVKIEQTLKSLDTIEVRQYVNEQQYISQPHIEPAQNIRLQEFTQNENKYRLMESQSKDTIERNEEYFLHQCPIEMCSILVKVIADILIDCGIFESQDQFPSPFFNLLTMSSNKSDVSVESEIFQRFLQQTKSLIEEKILEMTSNNAEQTRQIENFKQFSQVSQQNADIQHELSYASQQRKISQETMKLQSQIDLSQSESQNMQSAELNKAARKHKSMLVTNMQMQSTKSRISKKKVTISKQDGNDSLQTEHNQLKLKFSEHKHNTKELQLQLASKVVMLEEELERIVTQRDDEIQEIEELHKQELEHTRQGVQQRENKFISRMNDQKEKINLLEQQLKQAQDELKFVLKEQQETLKNRFEFDEMIETKNTELLAMRENVATYINMKSSKRGIFSIAFELNNSNESMINEAMLKYYLSKCLNIEKEKFRFLSTEEHITILQNYQSDQIVIVKIFIEIIDDQKQIDHYMNTLKMTIRDGTSLLYDIGPLYLSVNLGSSGFTDTNILEEYHLVKKVGTKIKEREFYVSILRHQAKLANFKIIAMSIEQGEEYILDLDEQDIFELSEDIKASLALEEPLLLINIIVDNLTLIEKDGAFVIACEHKIFFNDLFHKKLASKSDSGTQGQHQVITKSEQINQTYNSQLKNDSESQTDFDKQIIYEANETAYNGYQKLGKQLQFRLDIFQGIQSNILSISIDEVRSKSKMQLWVSNNESDQYFIYSESLKISNDTMVLISIEKLKQEGFLIKMHNLNDLASEEFYLVKKSNNSYTRLNRRAGVGLVIKDEFRNLIFDLTFAVNVPSSQVLHSNSDLQQERLKLECDKESFFFTNQIKKSVIKPQKHLESLVNIPAKVNLAYSTEKGILLYRNIYTIRCCFEGQEQTEQTSLISFYLKNDEVSVEVFLYKDPQKMSIASQVNATDLFGFEYRTLSYLQQVELLDQMMDKLFVISECESYHLKVENDAIPISTILEERQKDLSSDSNTQTIRSFDKYTQEKLKEIQDNRELLMVEGKVNKFTSFATIQDHIFEYSVYFLMKQDKESPFMNSNTKKRSIMHRRSVLERQISNISQFLEDNLDFEYIYIEASDKKQLIFYTLLSQKTLSSFLTQDKENQYANLALCRSKQQLAEFLKVNTQIDFKNEILLIEDQNYATQQGVNNYKDNVGGSYIRLSEKQNEEEKYNRAILKKLIMNQEIEMSEFQYDIKLYEIVQKSKETAISFQLEIFSLNEPEVIFNYNYPLRGVSFDPTQSMHVGVELFNLATNPFKNDLNNLSQQIVIENSQKTNFEGLFSKYIDNRVMLVVQHISFPDRLSFSLVEPTSKLQWSYEVEQGCKGLLTPDIAKLGVIDKNTLEMYFMHVLNQYKQQKIKIDFDQEITKKRYAKSKSQSYDEEKVYAEKHSLGSGIKVTISENLERVITIKLVKKIKKDSPSSPSNKSKKKMTFKFKSNDNNEKSIIKLLSSKDLDTQLIINIKEQGEILCLEFIDTLEMKILLKVVLTKSKEQIEREEQDDDLNNNIFDGLLQSLSALNKSETVSQSYNMLQQLSSQKDVNSKQENFHLNQVDRKMWNSQYKEENKEKTIVLHRKTFFDESNEKLIIVYVQLQIPNRGPHSQLRALDDEINMLKIIINEPETQRTNEFIISLDHCFTEEELSSVNKRDIMQLKRIAKILLEERAIIKRQTGDNNDDISGDNMYTVEINVMATQHTLENGSSIEIEDAKPQKPQQIDTSNQIVEMLEEEDEDDEDYEEEGGQKHMNNKLKNKEQMMSQQSIIQEEASQEDEDSPVQIREKKHQYINVKERRDEDSNTNVLFQKLMPNEQFLEIVENDSQVLHTNKPSFLIRRRSAVDDHIVQEQQLNEEQIRELLGFEEDLDLVESKDQVFEMLFNYFLNADLQSSS